jgi:ABC-type amino acid transport substrate-binding protein
MRGRLLELRRVLARRNRIDFLAAGVLLGYALLALLAEQGVSVAGQGLDPVWSQARARGTLRVAIDLGFYPFTWTEGGRAAGYDVDLARAVAGKLGLEAEFVPTGLDAVYDDLAARRADMAASALPYAPEQGWRASFSSFYFNAGQVLVAPVASPIAGPAELAGRTLAVPLGSDADTEARRMLAAGVQFTLRAEYDTPAEALDAVRAGAADAAIVDNAAALIGMRRPGLRIVEPALTLEPYVLVFAPESYELRERVNRALEELRREGFFDELGRRWFVEAPATVVR